MFRLYVIKPDDGAYQYVHTMINQDIFSGLIDFRESGNVFIITPDNEENSRFVAAARMESNGNLSKDGVYVFIDAEAFGAERVFERIDSLSLTEIKYTKKGKLLLFVRTGGGFSLHWRVNGFQTIIHYMALDRRGPVLRRVHETHFTKRNASIQDSLEKQNLSELSGTFACYMVNKHKQVIPYLTILDGDLILATDNFTGISESYIIKYPALAVISNTEILPVNDLGHRQMAYMRLAKDRKTIVASEKTVKLDYQRHTKLLPELVLVAEPIEGIGDYNNLVRASQIPKRWAHVLERIIFDNVVWTLLVAPAGWTTAYQEAQFLRYRQNLRSLNVVEASDCPVIMRERVFGAIKVKDEVDHVRIEINGNAADAISGLFKMMKSGWLSGLYKLSPEAMINMEMILTEDGWRVKDLSTSHLCWKDDNFLNGARRFIPIQLMEVQKDD